MFDQIRQEMLKDAFLPYLTRTTHEDTRLTRHVIECLSKLDSSRLTIPILKLEGMTGALTRHFYNNLCSLETPGRKTEYLEVGTWKGSSLVSAMYMNGDTTHATVVDNWSEFNTSFELDPVTKLPHDIDPRGDFLKNMETFDIKGVDVIEADFFTIPLKAPIDIYLYDGAHAYEDQYKAITYAWDALADDAIIMIDDWSMTDVKRGTMDALRDVNAHIIQTSEVTYPEGMESVTSGFWNGIGIFVIKKRQ